MARCAHDWERIPDRGSRYRCKKCPAQGYRRKWNRGPVIRYRCSGKDCQSFGVVRTWSGCYEKWWCRECVPKSHVAANGAAAASS